MSAAKDAEVKKESADAKPGEPINHTTTYVIFGIVFVAILLGLFFLLRHFGYLKSIKEYLKKRFGKKSKHDSESDPLIPDSKQRYEHKSESKSHSSHKNDSDDYQSTKKSTSKSHKSGEKAVLTGSIDDEEKRHHKHKNTESV